MIFEGSRYESSAVLSAVDAVGNRKSIIYFDAQAEMPTSLTYVTYTVQDGDRLDALADKFLGDATAWWQIAQVNPTTLFDPTDLPVGVVIRIPAI